MPQAVPGVYYSPYGNSIVDLILRQGDVAANRAYNTSQIWGNAIAHAGQQVGQALQQRKQEKQQQAQSQAFSGFIDSGEWQDPQKALAFSLKTFGPDRGAKIGAALSATAETVRKLQAGEQMNPEDALKVLPTMIHGLRAAPKELQPGLYSGIGDIITKAGWAKPGEVPPFDPNPKFLESLGQWADSMSPPKAEAGFTLSAGQVRYGPGGEKIAEGPPPAAPTLQHMETAKGIQTFNPKTGEVGPVIAQSKPPASLIVNPQSEEDVNTNAQMLIDGRAIPTTFGKRGKDYNHMIAVADKLSKQQGGKGYDPIRETINYEAAKRFATNMNSSQMIRFKGLAGSVVNTIDEVRALAEELKQGGVAKWNQAKRDTILEVYGNTPQADTAARYVAAVNTLKEEFANLAQGGYAPTESAWKLADSQINGNYGVKTFNASLNEVQRLINYRLHAFDELRPMMPGGGNQNFSQAEAAGRQPVDLNSLADTLAGFSPEDMKALLGSQ